MATQIDVDKIADSETLILRRYSVAGDGGISSFSQKFHSYVLRNRLPVNDDGTYTLGPRSNQVYMTIGPRETIPEVLFEGRTDEDIEKVVLIINGWGAGLEEVTASEMEAD